MGKTKTKAKPAAEPKPAGVRAPAPPPAPGGAPQETRGVLPLREIRPCPFNVRKHFDAADLRGLADSIHAVGLKDALLVRPMGADGAPLHIDLFAPGWRDAVAHFELADGERRFRALSLLAAEHELPPVAVAVRCMTDEEVRAVMLVSREQSRDLSVSELVAGYVALREGKPDDEAVAAMVGRPVGQVRSLLRLARLPAWALKAIDVGVLPRATAELVARVPGEEARKRAAGCVLLALVDPALLEDCFNDADTWEEAAEAIGTGAHAVGDPALSYRDTKDLIRNHFTKELKGAPFSLKVIDLVPGVPSCEACPKRAGNDPEATAEGTRADVCLDPDCYRQKLDAFRKAELIKAAAVGVEEAPIDGGFAQVPKGWCDVESLVWQTDLHADFPLGPNQHPKREEKLATLLAAPGAVSVPRFIEFDRAGKPVTLVRTEDARKALRSIGVLKKADPRPKAGKADAGLVTGKGRPVRVVSMEHGPTLTEIDERASRLAGDVLREYAADQCSALDGHEDAHEEGPIRGALELGLRAVCYDLAMRRDEATAPVLKRLCGHDDPDEASGAGEAIDKALTGLSPSRLLALLVEIAAAIELQFGSTARATAQGLLAFAELDWAQLCEQARRELTGGEAAEEKVAKAEAAQAAAEPESKPKKGAKST
jgi:ParB/RepB/Spo0J family partition protein